MDRFKNNCIFFHFSPISSHLHPLQAENCDSNSRLVVDEDDSGKLRLERVNPYNIEFFLFNPWSAKKNYENLVEAKGSGLYRCLS